MLYTYSYDQLNRLTSMVTSAKALNTNNNKWTFSTINNYKESVSYDGNGNILKYKRYGASTVMDSLNYKYYANTNRLNYITDSVPGGNYSVDIDNQSLNNYLYDSIGNTVKDAKEGINNIDWTVYGKIKTISKSDGTNINYTYDASGNRISKDVNGKQEWYVRDAGGNVMSVYSKGDSAINSGALSQSEVDLYGSSRLGVWKPHINVQNIVRGDSVWLRGLRTWGRYTTFTRGEKRYELTDHRGNVMAVVSDKKTGTDGNNDGVVNYYVADVVSASDYSSFGQPMPGRDTSFGMRYRYTFNGKELDKETGYQDYGMRIYDINGRFISVDPLTTKYPGLTPYQFASNTPIQAVDLDGGEAKYVYGSFNINSHPKLKQSEWFVINGQTNWATFSAAANYNTKTGNTNAYEFIYERSNYYKWANKVASSRGVNWFGAARDVTSENMVGAAEGINLWFMNSNTENFMAGANKFLFDQNIKNFGPWLIDSKKPITDGKNLFGHLSGAALDNQMVIIEQDKLQIYIDSYKADFIKKNGQKEWNDMAGEINGLFGNSFLRTFTPEANKYAAQEFKKKYGENAKFDFMNKEHRVFQGQKMAEFLRSQGDKKEAKKSVE